MMKVRLMQLVDFWVGVPLCALLSAINIASKYFLPKKSSSTQKVLCIELSEMGSAIIAHSALSRIADKVTPQRMYFLIFKRNAESVRLLNLIPPENVIEVEDTSFITFSFSALRALLTVRKLGIDTIVDLELFSRFTALFSFLSGAPNRIGFTNFTAEGLYRGNFLTHPVFYNPHQHMAANFLSLACALEPETLEELPAPKMDVQVLQVPLPTFVPTAQEQMTARDIVASVGYSPTPPLRIVFINPDPGDALPIRGWPIDRFAAISRQLLDRSPDILILIIGLERSEDLAQKIVGSLNSPRCKSICGKTKNLRELLTLFCLGELLLTNDSGPAHLASLTKIKICALFGPETPKLYGPLSPSAQSLYASYACSPCLSAHNHRHTLCTRSRCLEAIQVAEVASTVEKMLAV